ncbi:OmpH family outer membrane protein [Hirschia baltica]|uniref:Outer membrane chaperone Skp (OmpH) n=1 Tax=Hirschia baltica (strain ATCC 49814 / DSM 5838 / IFAM 1418) TaxID=582402 RepID=C6XJV1_HIRBI|nr:OmpH family outer membrane protein [Hirschia baltica]ACT59396.1 outer membrane chaperone Skp (OmpH) [Hirschia baltica ATCC 49814]
MSLKKLIVAFSTLFLLSPAVMQATAQTNVIVIDQAKIMTQSKAGKDVTKKLNNIAEQINKELKPSADSLQAEGQSLQTTLAPLNQNAIAQDKALVTRIQNFEKRRVELQKTQQKRAAELELTRRDAWQKFFVALEPALQAAITETSADIVIDRSSTIHTGEGVDQTDLIISKLDASTPTISVTKQSLPVPKN